MPPEISPLMESWLVGSTHINIFHIRLLAFGYHYRHDHISISRARRLWDYCYFMFRHYFDVLVVISYIITLRYFIACRDDAAKRCAISSAALSMAALMSCQYENEGRVRARQSSATIHARMSIPDDIHRQMSQTVLRHLNRLFFSPAAAVTL